MHVQKHLKHTAHKIYKIRIEVPKPQSLVNRFVRRKMKHLLKQEISDRSGDAYAAFEDAMDEIEALDQAQYCQCLQYLADVRFWEDAYMKSIEADWEIDQCYFEKDATEYLSELEDWYGWSGGLDY